MIKSDNDSHIEKRSYYFLRNKLKSCFICMSQLISLSIENNNKALTCNAKQFAFLKREMHEILYYDTFDTKSNFVDYVFWFFILSRCFSIKLTKNIMTFPQYLVLWRIFIINTLDWFEQLNKKIKKLVNL